MKLLLLVLALLPLAAVAQTIEETEKWIVSQANEQDNGGIRYSINGGDLESHWSFYGYVNDRTIPIASIAEVSYSHTDKSLAFFFKCDDDCAYVSAKGSGEKKSTDSYSDLFMLEMNGKIDPNMIPRMQKAFLHLIELHGGKAKLVPHQKKEETF